MGPWLRLGVVKTHCRKPLDPPDTLEANCHLSEEQTGQDPHLCHLRLHTTGLQRGYRSLGG